METLFTPATLAKRWECSERHVRNLIKSGQVKAFQLGGKLFRIRQSEVEAFESRSMAISPTPPKDTYNKSVKKLNPIIRARLKALRG